MCIRNCVDTTSWPYARHQGVFVNVSLADNIIRTVHGEPLSPMMEKRVSLNRHYVTTAILFLRHMNSENGVDSKSAAITISSGCGTPQWHTDGDSPALRTLMVPLSAGYVRHTEFMTQGGGAETFDDTDPGSGVYFSGRATHRSPQMADDAMYRWYMRIRFSWLESPPVEKERAMIESWIPPTLLETSFV